MTKITKAISVAIAILLTASCADKKNSVEVKGYTINGNVPEATSKTVYLIDDNNILIDSTTIKNNTFKISGNSEDIQLAYIQLKKDKLSIPIILENANYQLYATSKKQLVYGGKSQQTYNSYLEGLDQLNNYKLLEINNFIKFKRTEIERLNTSLNSIDKQIINYKIKALNTVNFTQIRISIIQELLNNNKLNLENIKEIAQITNTLNIPDLDSFIQLRLKELKAQKLKDEQKLVKTTIKRQLAPIFSGESLDGSDLGLKTVLKDKKVVLLDFWASWCGPCRQVTPQIRALYQKYKNKGFDIITISEDKNRSSWKNGLAEDQILDWNHIYDDDMRIAYMYNVSSIPHMVLIDGNGGIIDRKITVSKLSNELRRICK